MKNGVKIIQASAYNGGRMVYKSAKSDYISASTIFSLIDTTNIGYQTSWETELHRLLSTPSGDTNIATKTKITKKTATATDLTTEVITKQATNNKECPDQKLNLGVWSSPVRKLVCQVQLNPIIIFGQKWAIPSIVLRLPRLFCYRSRGRSGGWGQNIISES